MKVTISRNYADGFSISPTGSSWNEEMVVEMNTKEVMEILEIQVKKEALDQQLKPLYEACAARQKLADDKKTAERAEEKRLKELEAENTVEDGVVIG